MKTLQESILDLLDPDFDAQEMPSTNFPGADELLDILEKYDWKSYCNSDKEGMTYTHYGIAHKYTNNTFYSDLKDWIYKFGKKSKSTLYNRGTFVPEKYMRGKRTGNESTIVINLFDYGRAGTICSIFDTVKYGEEELSIQQPVPKYKYNYYIHDFAGELIGWFIKKECSK